MIIKSNLSIKFLRRMAMLFLAIGCLLLVINGFLGAATLFGDRAIPVPSKAPIIIGLVLGMLLVVSANLSWQQSRMIERQLPRADERR